MAASKVQKPYKFDEEAQDRFFQRLTETNRIGQSAAYAGVSRQTIADYRENDPEFERRFKEARLDHCELIEEAIRERGIEGWEITRYNANGEVSSVEHKFSEKCLEMYAKKHMPEYRDKQQLDVTHNGGVLVVPQLVQDTKEWEKNAKQQHKSNG